MTATASARLMSPRRKTTSPRGFITSLSERSPASKTSSTSLRSPSGMSSWPEIIIRSSSSSTSSPAASGLPPRRRTSRSVESDSSQMTGVITVANLPSGGAKSFATPTERCSASRLGTSSPSTSDRYDTTRVVTTSDTVSGAGVPRPSKTGAKDGASVEAPKAAEKNPATVTPICTAERNRLGSRAREATACPRPPWVSSRSTCPERSETSAISVAANTPPTRMNARTSRTSIQVPASTPDNLSSGHQRGADGGDGVVQRHHAEPVGEAERGEEGRPLPQRPQLADHLLAQRFADLGDPATQHDALGVDREAEGADRAGHAPAEAVAHGHGRRVSRGGGREECRGGRSVGGGPGPREGPARRDGLQAAGLAAAARLARGIDRQVADLAGRPVLAPTQPAVDDEPGCESGADAEVDHVVGLDQRAGGERGGVHVVLDEHRHAETLSQQVAQRQVVAVHIEVDRVPQHPALAVDQSGHADTHAPVQAPAALPREGLEHPLRGRDHPVGAGPGGLPDLGEDRAVLGEHDAVRLGASDVQADAPRARGCGVHRVHPAPRSSCVTAATPGADEPRVLRVVRPTSWVDGQPHSTTTAGRPSSASARRKASTSGRRPASRTCTTRGTSPETASGSPSASDPGSRRWSAGRPHATSPTAMLATVSTLTTTAPARPGSAPSTRVAEAAAPACREASGSSGWVAAAGTRIAATRPAASASRSWLRRPSATAATIASRTPSTIAAGLSGPRQRRSHPAARARTAASGMPSTADAPAMSSASLTTTPSKPSTSRSMPRTSGLRVAGRSGSIAGTTMCDVITAAVPASTAASKGTSSRAARVSGSTSMRGRSRWLSVAVSPWPGKCLAHAATPVDWSPRVHAATWAATCSGSTPKLRVPMTGLSGSLLTSASGARSRVTPTDASSWPTQRPTASVSSRSAAAPRAAAPSTGLGSRVCSRLTSPPSSSTATTAPGLAARISALRAASAAGPSAVLLPK